MTWQESYTIYKRYQAQADNIKKYHTEAIKTYKNKIIAIDKSGQWYFKLIIFSDFSASLRAIPTDHGCKSCWWAGTDILKSHFKDLARISKKNQPDNTIIPYYWEVLEPGFFAALDIQ